MKIVIPMAGDGQRFKDAGFTVPKPLIPVHGKPMIQRVVQNIGFLDDPSTSYIFIVREEHLHQYDLINVLNKSTKGRCHIIPLSSKTEGAACTVLKTRELFDEFGEEILIANSDQFVIFNRKNFNVLRGLSKSIIFCFNDTNPKWSFVECNKQNQIIRVVEKKPVSDIATCGLYYCNDSTSLFNGIDRMIEADDRVNGEFYLAPSFNYITGLKRPFYVEKMIGTGTPEDLDKALPILKFGDGDD